MRPMARIVSHRVILCHLWPQMLWVRASWHVTQMSHLNLLFFLRLRVQFFHQSRILNHRRLIHSTRQVMYIRHGPSHSIQAKLFRPIASSFQYSRLHIVLLLRLSLGLHRHWVHPYVTPRSKRVKIGWMASLPLLKCHLHVLRWDQTPIHHLVQRRITRPTMQRGGQCCCCCCCTATGSAHDDN